MSDNQRQPPTAVDLTDQSIHWDTDVSYGGYLHLDGLLSLQQPRSSSHDEMMFIVVHQASELWMKLAIVELGAAMAEIARGNPGPAFKMLARVSRIQVQLTESWAVLATMTPADYSSFRNSLGQSSGFQSYQYRQIEFMLGNKNPAMIRAHRNNPKAHALLERVLHEPSVYDLSLRLLHKGGSRCPPMFWSGTTRFRTRRGPRLKRPGLAYTATRSGIGIFTSSPRSSWISSTSFRFGGSVT